ncbi:hypothetical protein H0H87_009361 [Tephrocybe sp. NHM501043]|nr:hypothetical protein H0H87_009361 [Tephrocybe sp. NHM501043]
MKRGFLNIEKARKLAMKQQLKMDEPTPGVFFDERIQAGGSEDGTLVQLESGRTGIKMPFQKVDGRLPPGFKTCKPRLTELNPFAAFDNAKNDAMIYTTIPPKCPDETSADSPDGWSECLFRGGHQKQALFTILGFPSAVPKPPVIRHCIGPSAHGLGVFATVDIMPGDLIVAERPLLVFPGYQPIPLPDGMPSQLSSAEKLQARKAFLALFNSHTKDGLPMLGIARTNGIEFTVAGEGVTAQEKEMYRSVGVFDAISRVNHSCTPNATTLKNPSSFSLSLSALRPIQADEEIFISYGPSSEPTSERQSVLLSHGFSCSCTLCIDPGSDALIDQITKSKSTKPEIPIDQVVQDSIFWINVIEDAKLEHLEVYFWHLIKIIYAPPQYVGKARVQYEEKCDRWSIASYGKPYKTYIADTLRTD